MRGAEGGSRQQLPASRGSGVGRQVRGAVLDGTIETWTKYQFEGGSLAGEGAAIDMARLEAVRTAPSRAHETRPRHEPLTLTLSPTPPPAAAAPSRAHETRPRHEPNPAPGCRPPSRRVRRVGGASATVPGPTQAVARAGVPAELFEQPGVRAATGVRRRRCGRGWRGLMRARSLWFSARNAADGALSPPGR